MPARLYGKTIASVDTPTQIISDSAQLKGIPVNETIDYVLDLRVGHTHLPFYDFVRNFEIRTGSTGNGGPHVTGNYGAKNATSALEFKFIPTTGSSGNVVRIESLTIFIRDEATMKSSGYGGGPVLTGGIQIRILTPNSTSAIIDLTTGGLIYSNSDWAKYCYEMTHHAWSTNDEFIVARWNFADDGIPLRVDGSNNEYFSIVFRDSFTHLDDHTFLLKGYYENKIR